MKITILNGSPKGDISISMQYVHYIRKQYPAHEFKILNISHEIKLLEKDLSRWDSVIREIQSSDGILWATPVYYLLVPSQMKRFIELVSEREAQQTFNNKYAAALVTSVHCFDHTAINYLAGISEDLGMQFVGGFTPEMSDLTLPQGRTDLTHFASYFFHVIETKASTLRNHLPIRWDGQEYLPKPVTDIPKTGNKKIVILTDELDPGSNLSKMIDVFRKVLPRPVELIDLRSVDIRGGCQGCIHCGYENVCAYPDGMKKFIDDILIPADAVIIAGAIKDRYLSALWKMFFDRSFVYGHIPLLKDKQIGFIISGPLRQLPNLREIFEGYVQFQQSNLVGFVTDEDSSEKITRSLYAFTDKFLWAFDHDMKSPVNYLGFGVHLLMRDFVYRSRGIFQADHRYYKRHGMYKKGRKIGTINTVLSVVNAVPRFRREFQKQMKPSMIKGLKQVVDKE